jgi:hypothetical protein
VIQPTPSGVKIVIFMSDGAVFNGFMPVIDTVHHKITPKIDGRFGVKCPVRTVWPGRSGEGAGTSDGNGSDKHYLSEGTIFSWSHPSNGAISRMSE